MFTGLILTDTQRLASILSCSQSKLKEVISSYVSACSSYANWQLADLSDDMYADSDKTDWRTYASVLDDYYVGLGLQNTSDCPLFIIGGDDIVPMPQVPNPRRTGWFDTDHSEGREFLFSDIVYCFDTSNQLRLKDLIKDVISAKPRFAVGRLPLTSDWDIDVLNGYLNDCVYYATMGIPIRGAAMTTTRSWFRASKEMMRDIPTVSLSDEFVPIDERMIVSPDLDTQYKEMYEGYVHELKKIDFLVCNLHGSDIRENSFFLGEDSEMANYYIATQPSMLEKTTPLIFNTVACYGARYIEYGVKDSMLHTAMAYGTMLYCGSCDLALGRFEGGCSELMMKLYNIYLHKGIPAGKALIKAKQDYYRTCHDEENDNDAMFTILEFNLFGCPLLHMQPKLAENYQPTLYGRRIVEKQVPTYNPKTAKPIWNAAYQADDIHAYLQGLVDNNLSVIRQKVEKEIYQRLGLGKENLQQIYSISQNNYEVGFRFIYRRTPQTSYRQFEMYCFVETDKQGNITKIIHTK